MKYQYNYHVNTIWILQVLYQKNNKKQLVVAISNIDIIEKIYLSLTNLVNPGFI